jgi:hypothetical protein
VVYYRGGLVAGLRHGLGTALHLDGSRYTGEWAHGNMHGWGLMEYPGGMSYEGPFVDNARHGLGALSCPPDNGGGGDGGPPLVDPFALHDAHGAAEDPEDVFAALFPPALPDPGGDCHPAVGTANTDGIPRHSSTTARGRIPVSQAPP